MKRLSFLFFILLLISCKNEPEESSVKALVTGLITENAMVVSAREEASKIGIEILNKGGNAFDAMIATEMALAVVYPYAGNLGGGGFMVYRTQYGELGSFDYREKAPIDASKDMYLDEEGNYLQDQSKTGPLAVAVPGTVAGIFAIHEKLGSLPMEEILKPVIALAQRGFVVTELQARSFEKYREVFLEVNGETSIFTKVINVGDTLKNKALAKTLRAISEGGRAAFYNGIIGDKLLEYMSAKNMLITKSDLQAYEAEWREPIVINYKELKIISMAPPSSGGICLAQIMKMIEPYSLSEYGHNSLKTITLITEAERRSYADRSFYLGDPDFVDIPVDTLISEGYLQNRMSNFSFEIATTSENMGYGTILGYESTETTHYSIVDQYGNSVAATTTLNAAFGSKLYVKELGFFLNNEMDDFSAKLGDPNMFGLVGGTANAIAPQKRMLSSMTPTIVEKNGEPFMVLGTPGGSTIITSVLQTILNVYEFDMNMQEAVSAPRFHHQWLPDYIRFEREGFDSGLLKKLEQLGYVIDFGKYPIIGKVDAILFRNDGKLEGGADPRGDDTAVGF